MTVSSQSSKRFHLFGYPIAHSAAPAFHNECFDTPGRPRHHFSCWSTSKITIEMLDEIRSEELGGAAVTMPLKTEILQHLDELTPAAQATRACNTIVKVRCKDDGRVKLVGTNTDVLGVRNALLQTLKQQHPTHAFTINQRFPVGTASAVVIGGGATTRSAVYALHNLGLSPIFLLNRDADEVRLVMESFSSSNNSIRPELIHLHDVADVDRHLVADVHGDEGTTQKVEGRRPNIAMIVGAIPAIAPTTPAERLVYTVATRLLSTRCSSMGDATPTVEIGERSAGDVLPLPSTPIFLDMAYKPRLTPLLRIAAAFNWHTVGGVQAMIEQGLAQQRMWLVGSTEDAVACADVDFLGEEVERRARKLVEEMSDVVVRGKEVDRSEVVRTAGDCR